MSRWCPKHVWNITNSCRKHDQIMSETLPNHVWNMTKAYVKHDQIMAEAWRNHVWNMSKLCLKQDQIMSGCMHGCIHASSQKVAKVRKKSSKFAKRRQTSQKVLINRKKSLTIAKSHQQSQKVVDIHKKRQKWLFSLIYPSILWKSNHFAAYIRKCCFWDLRNRHPYPGSEIRWPLCRENSRVRSQMFDRGTQKSWSAACVTPLGENRQDPYSGHAVWGILRGGTPPQKTGMLPGSFQNPRET